MQASPIPNKLAAVDPKRPPMLSVPMPSESPVVRKKETAPLPPFPRVLLERRLQIQVPLLHIPSLSPPYHLLVIPLHFPFPFLIRFDGSNAGCIPSSFDSDSSAGHGFFMR